MKRLTNGFHSRYEKKKIYLRNSGINLTGLTEKNMRTKPSRLIVWCFLFTGAFAVWVVAAAATVDTSSNIELESGIYYTVKKGDTLWDISNRYFNTHWRWPQIWSENQQIMNPHRIFPGERLRLYHEVWDASMPPESTDQPATVQSPVVESRYYVYSSIHRIGFRRCPALGGLRADRPVQRGQECSKNDSGSK